MSTPSRASDPAPVTGPPVTGSRPTHGARGGPARSAPPDRPTRGKTAANRLRRIDHLIAAWDPALLRRCDGRFDGAAWVDLGFGASPVTTFELARRLRRVRPDLPVIGVENDPDRVASARSHPDSAADRRTVFVRGGFELAALRGPDGDPVPIRGVRAMNVLRQYGESEVAPAWRAMAAGVLPGGLVVEGTSEPTGRRWTVVVGRVEAGSGPTDPNDLRVEALVFGTNWRTDVEAAGFQAVLPKRLIHRMCPGEPIHAFMGDWARARRDEAGAATFGPRFALARVAARLRMLGHDVDDRGRTLRRGWLVWRNPPLAAAPGAGSDP